MTQLDRAREHLAHASEALGGPTNDREVWSYIDARVLQVAKRLPLDADAPAWPPMQGVWGGMVNGAMQKAPKLPQELVEAGVIFAPISDVLDRLPSQILQLLKRSPAEASDALRWVWNCAANYVDGWVLYVPPGIRCEWPLAWLQMLSGQGDGVAMTRHVIWVGADSHLDVLESHRGGTNQGTQVSQSVVQVVLEPSAHLTHARDLAYQAGGYGFHYWDVAVTAGASYQGYVCGQGGSQVCSMMHVELVGGQSSASVSGLLMPGPGERLGEWVHMEHLGGDSSSDQRYWGVLDGESFALYQGKASIYPNLTGVKALQSNHNIMLDQRARVVSKPELEIYADDVSCRHGSTTGFLDAQALAYLRSRGLGESQAKQLLIEAFLESWLAQLPPALQALSDWPTHVRERIAVWLER